MASDDTKNDGAATHVEQMADGSTVVVATPFECTEDDLANDTPEKSWRLLRGYMHDFLASAIIHGKQWDEASLAVVCVHGHLIQGVSFTDFLKTISRVHPDGNDMLTPDSVQRAVKKMHEHMCKAVEAAVVSSAAARNGQPS